MRSKIAGSLEVHITFWVCQQVHLELQCTNVARWRATVDPPNARKGPFLSILAKRASYTCTYHGTKLSMSPLVFGIWGDCPAKPDLQMMGVTCSAALRTQPPTTICHCKQPAVGLDDQERFKGIRTHKVSGRCLAACGRNSAAYFFGAARSPCRQSSPSDATGQMLDQTSSAGARLGCSGGGLGEGRAPELLEDAVAERHCRRGMKNALYW